MAVAAVQHPDMWNNSGPKRSTSFPPSGGQIMHPFLFLHFLVFASCPITATLSSKLSLLERQVAKLV